MAETGIDGTISAARDSPIYRVISYILSDVDDDGAWGRKDFDPWGPIITTLTVELLFNCGLKPEGSWPIAAQGIVRTVTLRKSLEWLDRQIKMDGKFGEDFWDACRLGELIWKYHLSDYFKNYDKLASYAKDYIDGHRYRTSHETWAGPGYLAAAVDYLDACADADRADRLFFELRDLQSEDGAFHGVVGKDGNELVHPIWHSAQALRALLRRGLSEKDARIKKIVQWIADSQEEDGSWLAFSRYTVYYTSYGILALRDLHNPPQASLRKAINWLVRQISENGKIQDSGGTIMGALALYEETGGVLNVPVGIVELKRLDVLSETTRYLSNENQRLEQLLQARMTELGNYRERFKEGNIVVTQAQALFYGLVLAVIGISATIITWLLSRP